MAERQFDPSTKSPSQCPGTAQSATSAGRSLIKIMFGILPRFVTEDPLGRRTHGQSAGVGAGQRADDRGLGRTAPGRWSRGTPASPLVRDTTRRAGGRGANEAARAVGPGADESP